MTATLRTRASLEDAVIAWILLVHPTGRAILGWPNSPRPLPLPYIKARIQSISAVGFDDRSALDVAGVQTLYGDRVMSVVVDGYGAGSLDLARALANSIQMQTVSAALIAAGLCPQGHDDVTDLTELLETEAEERAHLVMRFGIKEVYADTIGWIESVAGTGDILRADLTKIAISFAADLTP